MVQALAVLLRVGRLRAVQVVQLAVETRVVQVVQPSGGSVEWAEPAALAGACRTPVTGSMEIATALPMTHRGPWALPVAVSGSYSKEGATQAVRREPAS